MSQSITKESYAQFEQSFDGNVLNKVAMNAVTNVGLVKAATNNEAFRNNRHTFSIRLEQGDITNQKQSGRCWMFAALNTMRFEVMQKLNLKTFELSQSYPLFFDKMEKSNYFLENILNSLDEPTDGRLMSWLLTAPIGDGGQWDMFVGLVKKYGVVPKEAMPESVSSSATREMDRYVTLKLREDACILRKAYAEGASMEELQQKKQEMMEEIYRIVCICLGKPPKQFTFEVYDKDKNFIRDENITPIEFYHKYVGLNLDDYVSLINAPTKDKPYNRSYTVKFLGSVIEENPIRYLNVTSEELKRAAIAQMQDGKPVWFGCDVGQFSIRDNGMMDLDSIQLDKLLSTKFGMTKAERLDYGDSMMTHAMTFQGVNLDENGRPNRWCVENSWGKDPGKDGYYVMTDEWFDEFTYQVVVNKKYLTQEQIAAYESEPIVLQPWDPMGSLATLL
ncbi:MAG: aminopeptidase C [Lachnospiraceae bacterium]